LSVTLQDFTITYGDLTAVDSFSTTFPAGSTGLLGPNGAGKSSLIKGLLGLVPLASGSATVLGKDVRTEPKAVLQSIGYMPEDDCLIPGLTGVGMVQYAGELSGMNRVDALQRAHEVLFLVGLDEARYREVETYSAGMKQRIKLAQALVHDPRLLFLDEPTSGMDPKGRQEMLDLIQNISSREVMSIVLATHIMVDVERTCDRVVIMNKGRVLQKGSMQDLRGTYSDVYTVRVEGEHERFRAALEREGCAVQPGGKYFFDVTVPELVTSIQTLEDVFLKVIGEDDHADL